MQIENDLIKIICKIENASDMHLLFQELFTEAELVTLNLRWKLMKDLYSGMSQRKIAEKYGISLCKITRGSKVLKKENSSVLKILGKIFEQKKGD